MRPSKSNNGVFLGMPPTPEQEFSRAMWCPEVEGARQSAENEVAYHRVHDRPFPLRVDPHFIGHDRTYAVTLRLTAWELGDMRGKGNEMIQWIARELVERINHDSLYTR